MPITESKKQSDLEKRLRILRQQVYGKNLQKSDIKVSYSSNASTFRPSDKLVLSDLTYLYQDLLKILILSSLAIGAQLILFILLKNHLLSLKFL